MPLSSKDQVTLEEHFFLSLTRAGSIIHKIADASLKRAGLTLAEYNLLRIVENTPGITAGEARSRLYATAPSVAQLVAQLTRRSLLQRLRDPKDARRLPLALTASGRSSLRGAKREVSSMLKGLSLPPRVLPSLVEDLTLLLSSLPSYGDL